MCLAAPPRPREILLVEDNPGDVYLTREAFRLSGPGSLLRDVRDGDSALRYLRRQGEFGDMPRPDLVLLDLNLPGKDGFEVLSEMKADPELSRIPVVVLSSSSSNDDVRVCYDRFANCYITKPQHFEGLLAAIEQVQQFWLRIAALPSHPDGG